MRLYTILIRLTFHTTENDKHETSSNTRQVPKEFSIGVSFKNIWNRHFTGRNQTLLLMNDFLRPEPRQQEPHVAIIYGTGGVGKTQLALEYARRQQQNYASLFWIDAHRPETVKASIGECVGHILAHYHLHGMTDSPRFAFLENEMEYGTAEKAFFTWLGYEDNRPWLLVIDNLDDLESVSLREILPSTKWGSVLVTSRRSDLAVTWDSIQIPVMDHDEAYELLVQSSNLKPENGTEGTQPDTRSLTNPAASNRLTKS